MTTKNAITALSFDESGTCFASGSRDTDIILWDVVEEAGLYRYVMSSTPHFPLLNYEIVFDYIVIKSQLSNLSQWQSISHRHHCRRPRTPAHDNTFMKVCDLSTQQCVQIIVAHRSEVWSMAINRECDLVFTGSGEGELKARKVDCTAIADGLKETETGEVS